jgi:hypothetical protein
MEEEPARFDIMYKFATAVITDLNDLEGYLEEIEDDQRSIHSTGRVAAAQS